MTLSGSPYPLGAAVTDPGLLQNRHREIGLALNTVAPEQSRGDGHAVLLGEQRSGRSSVLTEVARRAASERGRLVVRLRDGTQAPSSRPQFIRHLLTATAEALAARGASGSSWYLAWRDRVYLRDRSASTEHDKLSSALMFAVDPDAEVDLAVLERDLKLLLELAQEASLTGIVVCIDDASSLTEDVTLVEELLSTADAVGGFNLLLAGNPATAEHFVEAASPCLARFVPIRLRPFRGPRQIFTCLSASLPEETRSWIRADDAAFLRDVLRLTGGNPYEVMLVGHHLWLTCQRGEQDRYALTPRVLDRVIPDLALLASGGDALLDGAQAIDRLAEEQVRQAVELVALSRLTVRQIAIARILKIDSRDVDRVDRRILKADISEETKGVLGALEELQEAGVVQLHPNRERFNVVGGRPASVLLKYKARARIGAEASSQPFELGYLLAVGRALARDSMRRAVSAFDGGATLGFAAILSQEGAGRLSPRPAIRALSTSGDMGRLVQAEIDLNPWDDHRFGRIAELLTEDEPVLALVNTAIAHDRELLEYTEIWELPPGVGQEDVDRVWSTVIEEWQPVVAAADLNWTGNEIAVVRGERARQALVVLQRFAATSAVHKLFDRWLDDRDERSLARSHQIGDEAIATMRATGLSEWESLGELSGMLSRVGFLKSLDDGLLHEAQLALEEALSTGDADKWVTQWNLANVVARQGELPEALRRLDALTESIGDWHGYAFVLVLVAGRAARESLIKITDIGVRSLVGLQRAVLLAMQGDDRQLADVVLRCQSCDDEGAAQAADWVAESLALVG